MKNYSFKTKMSGCTLYSLTHVEFNYVVSYPTVFVESTVTVSAATESTVSTTTVLSPSVVFEVAPLSQLPRAMLNIIANAKLKIVFLIVKCFLFIKLFIK